MAADLASRILVTDPVDDPHRIFTAAREVLGLTIWHHGAEGPLHRLEARDSSQRGIRVSVEFPAAGGTLTPPDREPDQPAGRMLITITTPAGGSSADRDNHERLIAKLGWWLTQQRLEWEWQYAAEPWLLGPPPIRGKQGH